MFFFAAVSWIKLIIDENYEVLRQPIFMITFATLCAAGSAAKDNVYHRFVFLDENPMMSCGFYWSHYFALEGFIKYQTFLLKIIF
jgi:hypothetical protein